MSRHVICPVDELPPGTSKIVSVRGRQVGVFNVNGTYDALLNRCPHRAAPLCKGPVTGLIEGPEPYVKQFSRDGEILRCPWHGWEFDITNGQSVFNPHRIRTRSYEVFVEPDGSKRETIGVDDPDPELETFPVAVEQQLVVLYLGQSKPSRTPAAPVPATVREQ